MTDQITGRARVLGDNVNTDDIVPGRYLNTADPVELAKHLWEDRDPDFGRSLTEGDIIVAGANFGCGSSREHAPAALKQRGVACVVADSFARIFYRNAYNIGLAIIECPGAAAACAEGEHVSVDIAHGQLILPGSGQRLEATPIPPFMRDLLAAGGLIPYVRGRLAAERGEDESPGQAPGQGQAQGQGQGPR
jgi:3-isopropylmalate/(R)-2-methylmalate dehydratase small subunit